MDPRTRATIGGVTPSTLAISQRVLEHLEERGTPLPNHPETGYPVIWGKGSSSEHATGRALDFMVTAKPDVGDAIADYLWQHRAEFGLIHIIWRQRIRSTRTQPGVWRAMPDRGSPTENHMDHPHGLFDGRAVNPPSATSSTSKPTTTKGLTVRLIDLRTAHRTLVKGAGVRPLQRLLTVPADGLAGPATRTALAAAQRRAGLPVDYIFGPTTAEALLAGKA